MNIIYALLITIALITVTSTVWYVTQPVGYFSIDVSSNFINGTANLDAATKANVDMTFNLEKLLLNFWGPILDFVYVIWFLIFGTRVDTESERTRGIYYG